MIDFRKVYQDVPGACASCKHARSIVVRPDGHRHMTAYDGGHRVACAVGNHSGAYVNDRPDMRYAKNECWVAPTKPASACNGR